MRGSGVAHVRVVNPMQMKDMEQALREETQRDERVGDHCALSLRAAG